MAKSRNFSLYLLKLGFNSENALKEDHTLHLLKKNEANLPAGVVGYVYESRQNPPWWREFFKITYPLGQQYVHGIFFIPVKNRIMALTFGSAYHKLKENSYEYDFGIKTVLNIVDPAKVKSTDWVSPETARRQRIQLPTATGLKDFMIDDHEHLIKRLVGTGNQDVQSILKNISGSANLRITSEKEANDFTGLCEKIYEFYKKDDYKKNFPGILDVVPIKDPDIISKLDEELLKAFKHKSKELMLAIPELLDYSSSFYFQYKAGSKRSENCEEVFIEDYITFTDINNIEINCTDAFKNHFLHQLREDGNILGSYSIYKTFIFDLDFNNKTYHLCEGNWYEINSDYLEKLNNLLDPKFIPFKDHPFLIEYGHEREDKYNLECAESSDSKYHVICLDKKNISPNETQIEPCDLIAIQKDGVELIHVKISVRSATLSHLFNQGRNSIELLRNDSEARNALKKLVSTIPECNDLIDEGNYTVTFAIITNKPEILKAKSLPFFSRMSLANSIKSLTSMKAETKVVLIPDMSCKK